MTNSMKRKIIYEDERVMVKTTGHDYDFIATIQNKTNSDFECFIGKDDDRSCVLKANDWVGILADGEGYEDLELIKEYGIGY